jgi:hypothetical protein
MNGVVKEKASIIEMLKEQEHSNKAITEILKWYTNR